jgi:hypothetical protein
VEGGGWRGGGNADHSLREVRLGANWGGKSGWGMERGGWRCDSDQRTHHRARDRSLHSANECRKDDEPEVGVLGGWRLVDVGGKAGIWVVGWGAGVLGGKARGNTSCQLLKRSTDSEKDDDQGTKGRGPDEIVNDESQARARPRFCCQTR